MPSIGHIEYTVRAMIDGMNDENTVYLNLNFVYRYCKKMPHPVLVHIIILDLIPYDQASIARDGGLIALICRYNTKKNSNYIE